jgi:hypothetical protein
MEIIDKLYLELSHISTATTQRELRLKAALDDAYSERNRLIALLALIYPSTQCRTAIDGWEPQWHNCVYIHLPDMSQLSWHYHDCEEHLFHHVPYVDTKWDGHTTEEKYARIRKFIEDSNTEYDRRTKAATKTPDETLPEKPSTQTS